MRRTVQNLIAILLAVLTFGTAFPNVAHAERCEEEILIEYLQQQIVPEFKDTALKTLHYRNYPQVAAARDALNRFADLLVKNGTNAQETFCLLFKRVYGKSTKIRITNALQLDWKLVGTLLFTYHERITDVLRKNLRYTVDPVKDIYNVTISFAPYDDLLWLDNETEWFAARNTYCYLNTVYNDDGTERAPTGYWMTDEKLDRLAFPLDAKWYTRIKTTWFRSRDGGARRHTGMDIRCAHGSPIYACAGGVVNSVGFHQKGGYYVSVVDDDGCEYFYYHMKRDSQIVRRGQRVETGEQLGLSGNTGNSAAPHLHLSIITPEKRFIDPFNIYYRWVYRKTGMQVKKPS